MPASYFGCLAPKLRPEQALSNYLLTNEQQIRAIPKYMSKAGVFPPVKKRRSGASGGWEAAARTVPSCQSAKSVEPRNPEIKPEPKLAERRSGLVESRNKPIDRALDLSNQQTLEPGNSILTMRFSVDCRLVSRRPAVNQRFSLKNHAGLAQSRRRRMPGQKSLKSPSSGICFRRRSAPLAFAGSAARE